MFVTAAHSQLPSLMPSLIWGLVVGLVIPALLIFCNSAMKIHTIVANGAKKIHDIVTKMRRDDATAHGARVLTALADDVRRHAIEMALVLREMRELRQRVQHRNAEQVPPADLRDRRIDVDGYGPGTVTGFKKGCFFGIGPSKHTVQFDNSHIVKLLLRRHKNGGAQFVLC